MGQNQSLRASYGSNSSASALPPSNPSSTSTGGGSSSSGGSNGVVSKRSGFKDTWGTIALEISLNIVISMGLFYTIRVLQRLLLGNTMAGPGTDVDNTNVSAAKRLEKILQKREIENIINEVKNKNRQKGKSASSLLKNANKSEQAEIAAKATAIPLLSIELTSHESHIAEDVIDPDDIDCSFEDIGGMDNIKQEMWELAVLPIMRPDLFASSKLASQPTGILLHGLPGTGKTMLAKAIAKEAKAIFIPIKLSKILNKWVGESNKLVAATFSLAKKLAPAIIFIDELDTFLNKTNSYSSSHLETLKAEFLTLWDGITTTKGGPAAQTGRRGGILVLGATNKPENIDAAIKRRMPRDFYVPLPSEEGRLQILNILLKDDEVKIDNEAKEFIPELARLTERYSGSDLKELCRAAIMQPIREVTSEIAKRAVMGKHYTENGDATDGDDGNDENDTLRPLSKKDFFLALEKVKASSKGAQIPDHYHAIPNIF